MINYDEAAGSYDHTRKASEDLVAHFGQLLGLGPDSLVLDFGCGTGNYLQSICERYGCQGHGVEPSEEMRKRAVEKNPRATVVAGDHAELPFEDGVFDFIYLTDVIHHVPDLGVLFRNFRRVLKVAGRVCVVTESHAQIGARFYNRYFPSMEAREKERYPDLPAIVAAAQGAGLTLEGVETRATGGSAVVTEELVRTVEEKSFSMFRRLEEEEWRQGLERMRRDLGRSFENEGAGVSLVLLGA